MAASDGWGRRGKSRAAGGVEAGSLAAGQWRLQGGGKKGRVETQAQTFKPTLSHRKLAHLAQINPSRHPARLSDFLIRRGVENASGIWGCLNGNGGDQAAE